MSSFVWAIFDREGTIRELCDSECDIAVKLHMYCERFYDMAGKNTSSLVGDSFASFKLDSKLRYWARPLPIAGSGPIVGLLRLNMSGWVCAVTLDTDVPALVKILTGYDVETKHVLDDEYLYTALMVDGKDAINWLGYVNVWEM